MEIDDPVRAGDGPEQPTAQNDGGVESPTKAQPDQAPAQEATIPQQTPDQRLAEMIERSNAWLASSTAWLDDNRTKIEIARGQVHRNQADLKRRKATTRRRTNPPPRHAPPHPPVTYDPGGLRQRSAAIAAKFAETEDSIAEHHDQLATENPDRTAACQRIADEARAGARRAREIADYFRG